MMGIFIGSVISIVFNINSEPTASKFSYLIFGIHSESLIKMIILFLVSSGVAGLAGLSMLVRDFEFPREYPSRFFIEFCVASIFPAILLIVMTYLRNSTFTSYTFIEFVLLALKFGVLHILLQFSGVYSSIFQER